MKALTGLPSLDLAIQGEARSAARRLWRQRYWSWLQPNRGHSSILTRIRRFDPIFSMEVDVMRPAFNLEPKYRVTMLITEEWTREPGTPPVISSYDIQMGPRRWGYRCWDLWAILKKNAQYSSRKT